MNEKYEDEWNVNNVCELYGAVWIVFWSFNIIKNWTKKELDKNQNEKKGNQ